MTRARLATLLGVQIAEEPHFVHYQAYGSTVPPRRMESETRGGDEGTRCSHKPYSEGSVASLLSELQEVWLALLEAASSASPRT